MLFILQQLTKNIEKKKYTMKKREKFDAKLFKNSSEWTYSCKGRPVEGRPVPRDRAGRGPRALLLLLLLLNHPFTPVLIQEDQETSREQKLTTYLTCEVTEIWSLGKRSVIEYGQLLCSLLMPRENFRSIDQKPRQLSSLLDNSFTVIINISLPCNF